MENLTKFLFLFFVISIFVVACAKAEPAAKEIQQVAVQEQTIPKGDAKTAFTDLLSNKITTFMVSYHLRTDEEFSNYTLYQKGGRLRFDTFSDGEEASIFFLEDKAYSCTKNPKICVFLKNLTRPSTGVEDIEKNTQNYSFAWKPLRTIAGTTAKCFGISSSQGSSEVCYSGDGILLYTKSESDNKTMEMTATDYSTSVSDSVFVLPAEPQDINAMMAQYKQ